MGKFSKIKHIFVLFSGIIIVALTASEINQVLDRAINLDHHPEAKSVIQNNGNIKLMAPNSPMKDKNKNTNTADNPEG